MITTVVVGGGMYLWQNGFLTMKGDPISYSGIADIATVTKTSGVFEMTVDQLEAMADECGTEYPADYFDGVVNAFEGATTITYNFKYRGASQDPDTYTITALSNERPYESFKEFQRDFNFCAAGETYPLKSNGEWLLFGSSCGTGFADDSGDPIGCQEIADILDETLTLN